MMIAGAIALALVASRPQTESIRELVERLDADGLEDRQKAADELVRRGEAALPDLRRTCGSTSADHRLLARRLIRRIILGAEATAKFTRLNLGLEEALAWEHDPTWTTFFLEVAGSESGRERYPDLTAADLSPLVAPAYRGAETDEERSSILSDAARRKILGAIPLLKALLSDPVPETRAMALLRLSEIKGPESASDALPLLDDPSDWVRDAAFGLFESLHARSAVPRILELLERPDPAIRDRAVRALRQLGSRKAVPGVLPLLKDPSPVVRAHAAETLGILQALDAEGGLERLLADPDEEVRQAAAFALYQLDSEKAVPELIRLARTGQPGPGAFALWYLESVAPDECRRLHLQFLRDPAAPFRESAVDWFSSNPSPEAVPELLKLTHDRKLGRQAVLALGASKAPEAVPALVELLGEPGRELEVIRALRTLGAPEAIPGLLRCLESENDTLRSEAAWALVPLPNREKVPALRKLLKEGTPMTARAAAIVLGESGAREAIPELLARLGGEDPPSVVDLATALAKLGSPRGAKSLRETLTQSPIGSERRNAASALKELSAREAIPDLVRALKDEEDQVRYQALDALQALQATNELPQVLPLLKDRSTQVSVLAFRTLVQWGASSKGPELRELLKGEDEDLQARSAEALGKLGVREAVPDLVRLLNSPNPEVLAQALDALGNLGAREAVPDARRLLGHEDETVRMWASLTLAKVGAGESAPDLAKLLKDPSPKVARAALQSLVWLDRDEAMEGCASEAARGDDSFFAWRGQRDPEGAGWPCGNVVGGDFLLNAYRTPGVWNRLRPLWFVREPRDTLRQALERISRAAGLPLSWPAGEPAPEDRLNLGRTQWVSNPGAAAGGSHSAWMPDGAEARSPLLRALQASAEDGGYEVLLESDRIRLVPHAEAVAVWKAWWREERKKPAGK